MKIFKIVVVDDEPKITNTLCRILRNAGYVAYGAYEAEGALILCRHYSVDMLISDVNMPAISGIELARQVCRELPACHIVLFSGHSDTAGLLSQAIASGSCFECLAKSLHPDVLLATVRSVAERVQAKTA